MSSYQVVGDYVLEYENPFDDCVSITVWKTHRDEVLPFSEVIKHYNEKIIKKLVVKNG